MLKIAAFTKIAVEMNIIPADRIADVINAYRQAGATEPFEKWAVATNVITQVAADRLVVAFCNSNFRCQGCEQVSTGAQLVGELDVKCPLCQHDKFKRVQAGAAGAPPPPPPPPATVAGGDSAPDMFQSPDTGKTLLEMSGSGAPSPSGGPPAKGVMITAQETHGEPSPEDFERGLQPGQRIGNWEIIKLAGKGGMGAVYKARNPALDQFAAIKVLNANYLENSTQVKRFREEARACAKLEHPNIVQVKDFGEVCGRAYLILQWVDGGSLQDKIKAEGPMGLRELLDVGIQACRGFAEAHKFGIVHRDIKPDNMMITPEGRIKIADFGLAKSLEAKEGLTATGYFLGTPAYISPEQINNTNITPASDIYSLGATFYHMLVGKVPFKAGSIATVLHKHIAEEFPSLRWNEGRDDIPEPLDNLIQHMCAKRSEDRPQSMNEVADILEVIRRDLGHDQDVVRDVTKVNQSFTKYILPTKTRLDALPPEERKKVLESGSMGLVGDTVERPSERHEPAKAGDGKKGGGALIAMFLILLLAGGGAGYWYFVLGPGAAGKGGANGNGTGPLAGGNETNDPSNAGNQSNGSAGNQGNAGNAGNQSNTGNANAGNANAGNQNAGNQNAGNSNAGNQNAGNTNANTPDSGPTRSEVSTRLQNLWDLDDHAQINAELDEIEPLLDRWPNSPLPDMARRLRRYAEGLMFSTTLIQDAMAATPDNAARIRADIEKLLNDVPQLGRHFDAALAHLDEVQEQGLESGRAVIRGTADACNDLQAALDGSNYGAVMNAYGTLRESRRRLQNTVDRRPELEAEAMTVLGRCDTLLSRFDGLASEYNQLMMDIGEIEGFIAGAEHDVNEVNIDRLREHQPKAEEFLQQIDQLKLRPVSRFDDAASRFEALAAQLKTILEIDLAQRLPEEVQRLIDRAAGADIAPAAKLMRDEINTFLQQPGNDKWASTFEPVLAKLKETIDSAPANVEPLDPNLPRVTARFQRVGPLRLTAVIPGASWSPDARPVLDIAFEPNNNRMIAAVGAENPRIVMLRDGSTVRELDSKGKEVHSVEWTSWRSAVLMGCNDGNVRAQSGTTFRPLRFPFNGHFDRSANYTVTVLRQVNAGRGQYMFTASDDRKVIRYDLASMMQEDQYALQQRTVTSVDVSPDGKWVAVGSEDARVRVYALDGAVRKKEFTSHLGPVRAVAFSPDGNSLVSASDDGQLKIFDPEGRERMSLVGHAKSVKALAIIDGGRYIVSGGDDGTLRIWDLESGDSLVAGDLASDAGYVVTTMRLSLNRKLLAVGTQKGDVLVFDISDGWRPE